MLQSAIVREFKGKLKDGCDVMNLLYKVSRATRSTVHDAAKVVARDLKLVRDETDDAFELLRRFCSGYNRLLSPTPWDDRAYVLGLAHGNTAHGTWGVMTEGQFFQFAP